jgi:hypothetical protein
MADDARRLDYDELLAELATLEGRDVGVIVHPRDHVVPVATFAGVLGPVDMEEARAPELPREVRVAFFGVGDQREDPRVPALGLILEAEAFLDADNGVDVERYVLTIALTSAVITVDPL